jgi:hypothetical protein
MSKVFNAYYFSAANNYGCEETYRQRQEADLNAEYELYEAEQDLKKGISDNLPEFVWMENNEMEGMKADHSRSRCDDADFLTIKTKQNAIT